MAMETRNINCPVCGRLFTLFKEEIAFPIHPRKVDAFSSDMIQCQASGVRIDSKTFSDLKASKVKESNQMPEKPVSVAANAIAGDHIKPLPSVTFQLPFDAVAVAELDRPAFMQRYEIRDGSGKGISLLMSLQEAHAALHWLDIGWREGLREGLRQAQASPKIPPLTTTPAPPPKKP